MQCRLQKAAVLRSTEHHIKFILTLKPPFFFSLREANSTFLVCNFKLLKNYPGMSNSFARFLTLKFVESSGEKTTSFPPKRYTR